jgi:hypothetical protein
MEAYEGGGHAYHATMPTDALRGLRDTMVEMKDWGFDAAEGGAVGSGRQGPGAPCRERRAVRRG